VTHTNFELRKLVCVTNFLLLCGWLLLAIPGFSAPTVSVSGDSRPGGVLLLTVNDSEAKPSASWGRFHIVFFKDGSQPWRALLPVWREMKSGVYPLQVKIATPAGDESVVQRIHIFPRHFGRQSIWMSNSLAKEYDDPSVEAEYDLLDSALSAVSTDQVPTGPFRRPIPAPITTPYGLSRFVNGESTGWHRGIDFGAGMGTPIRAPARGRIVLVRRGLKLHGNVVVIDHGQGLTTLYIHLQKILVKKGETVSQGTVIATVGMSGAATGPNLHWGAYVYGVPIDPTELFSLPKM